MDAAQLFNLRERLKKEQKWIDFWRKENEEIAKENGDFVPEPTYEKPNHKSSAILALEQNMGHEPNPFAKKNCSATEALYYGVSSNEQGRWAYLKKRGREGPNRR